MSVETSAVETDSTSADYMASVSSSEKQNRVSGFAISDEVVLETKDVNVYYGNHHALHDTSLAFHKDEITALIGPSGCGKSTFLRSLNLMNREIRGCRVEGEIEYRGHNINTPSENLYELRSSPIRFICPSTTTSRLPLVVTACGARTSLIRWSRRVCAGRPCGMRLKTSSTKAPLPYPVASSSACASRAPLPCIPM